MPNSGNAAPAGIAGARSASRARAQLRGHRLPGVLGPAAQQPAAGAGRRATARRPRPRCRPAPRAGRPRRTGRPSVRHVSRIGSVGPSARRPADAQPVQQPEHPDPGAERRGRGEQVERREGRRDDHRQEPDQPRARRPAQTPGRAWRRDSSPASAASPAMTTAMPASSTGLSAVPKVFLANSVRNCGEIRITPSPTARNGDERRRDEAGHQLSGRQRGAHREQPDQGSDRRRDGGRGRGGGSGRRAGRAHTPMFVPHAPTVHPEVTYGSVVAAVVGPLAHNFWRSRTRFSSCASTPTLCVGEGRGGGAAGPAPATPAAPAR